MQQMWGATSSCQAGCQKGSAARESMPNSGILLCIDDDVRCVAIRKLMLQSVGFKVFTSTSPRRGLMIFETEPIEAVILDYHMAEMDGGQLAAAMRRIKPHVPLLMLSALPTVPQEARELVDAFVSKASPTQHLISEIEQLLAA